MTLKTMTICLHRALLSRKNTLFFAFCVVEEVYLVVHSNDANLGLIIFYVVNCYE